MVLITVHNDNNCDDRSSDDHGPGHDNAGDDANENSSKCNYDRGVQVMVVVLGLIAPGACWC